MEQYMRRDSLEISGIPQPTTEADKEQTSDTVLQLSEKIGVQMQRCDISVSHRIPSRQHGDVRQSAIIVKFVSGEG